MARIPARLNALFAELRRRHVFRVAALYALVAYGIMQVANNFFPPLGLPEWTLSFVAVLCVLGFPVALVLAYALEITPAGIQRAEDGPVPAHRPAAAEEPGPRNLPWRRIGVAAALVGVVLAGAGFYSAQFRTVLSFRSSSLSSADDSQVSLAVLPFEGIGVAQDRDFLPIGIPDAIITQLSTASQMRVRPTSAVLAFQGAHADLQLVGRELGVQYVLTGTLQEIGDRVRVGVQLVRVEDGASVWGERYHLSRADLLALQDEVAANVAAALKIRFSSAERDRLRRLRGADSEVSEAYLRGRVHMARHTEHETRLAIEAFEDAIAQDPEYALAYAGLAMARAEMGLRHAPQEEVETWHSQAMRDAERALQLDPELAEAHEALATIYRKGEFDWDRTIRESKRALALNPSLEAPHYYIAGALYHLGVMDPIEAVVKAGMAANPTGDHVEPLRTRGFAALYGGRFKEAVVLLEQAQGLSDESIADWGLGLAYFYVGDVERSIALLEQAQLLTSASASTRAKVALASILASRGERERAQSLTREVQGGPYMDHHTAYHLGAAHAQLGNPGEAVRWLRQAADTGFPCYPWFASDPLLHPLRTNAEYAQFQSELRARWQTAEMRYGGDPSR